MRKNYLIDSRHSYSIVSRLCELPDTLTYEWMTKYHELYRGLYGDKCKTLEGRRPVVYIENGVFKGWDLYASCSGLNIISLNFNRYYDRVQD